MLNNIKPRQVAGFFICKEDDGYGISFISDTFFKFKE